MVAPVDIQAQGGSQWLINHLHTAVQSEQFKATGLCAQVQRIHIPPYRYPSIEPLRQASTVDEKAHALLKVLIKGHASYEARRVLSHLPSPLLGTKARALARKTDAFFNGKRITYLQVLVARVIEVICGLQMWSVGLTKGRRRNICIRMVQAHTIIAKLQQGTTRQRYTYYEQNKRFIRSVIKGISRDQRLINAFIRGHSNPITDEPDEGFAQLKELGTELRRLAHVGQEFVFEYEVYQKIWPRWINEHLCIETVFEDARRRITRRYSSEEAQFLAMCKLFRIACKPENINCEGDRREERAKRQAFAGWALVQASKDPRRDREKRLEQMALGGRIPLFCPGVKPV